MLKAVKSVTNTLERIQVFLGCIMFSIFVVAVVCQVTSRIISVPMVWTEDLANYSFIWSIFMGASVIYNRGQHFRFNMVEMKLSGKGREIYNIIIYVCILAFCVLVFIYGIQLVKSFWSYKWNSIPTLKMGYHWLCVPIMGASMAIYSVGHIAECIDNLIHKNYHKFDLLESIEELEDIEITDKTDLEGGETR